MTRSSFPQDSARTGNVPPEGAAPARGDVEARLARSSESSPPRRQLQTEVRRDRVSTGIVRPTVPGAAPTRAAVRAQPPLETRLSEPAVAPAAGTRRLSLAVAIAALGAVGAVIAVAGVVGAAANNGPSLTSHHGTQSHLHAHHPLAPRRKRATLTRLIRKPGFYAVWVAVTSNVAHNSIRLRVSRTSIHLVSRHRRPTAIMLARVWSHGRAIVIRAAATRRSRLRLRILRLERLPSPVLFVRRRVSSAGQYNVEVTVSDPRPQ